MYAVVEWCKDPGQEAFSTCIKHTKSKIVAESEAEVEGRPTPPFLKIDEAFSYEVVGFEDGDPCPICKRNFEF